MPVEPSGQGEHLWLEIQKSGCNTDWLARELARVAEVKPMAVSYAGLKDRNAITTQWFSIQLPGRADPDLSSIESEDVKILQKCRHDRKLKRGALTGNQFELCIRDLSATDDELEERLKIISEQGVPNYFGEQRFGHDMANLDKASKLFTGVFKKLKKNQRSIYLSAARSWIFNQVLSERIRQGNWNRHLDGDVFMLDGKSACFADDGSEDIADRLANKEIHPTGPLWGKGESMAKAACLELENNIASHFELFCEGLIKANMKQERRSLRLMANNMTWEKEDASKLRLQFELPAGAYATMVIREIINTENNN